MKQSRIPLQIDGLNQSIGLCSQPFVAQDARVKGDWARWIRRRWPVNFSISARIQPLGIGVSPDKLWR